VYACPPEFDLEIDSAVPITLFFRDRRLTLFRAFRPPAVGCLPSPAFQLHGGSEVCVE
jgi:hypothetical protein